MGTVVAGPQRITYTAKYPGGGGGLVGTGAAPSGAPVATPASGAGLSDGPRDYAVTFVTAAGQSIPGPRATITSGLTPAPITAPIAAVATIGSGPDPGSHDYAVTFVTSSGETTPSPIGTRATGETPEPVAYPVPGIPTVGTGITDGGHEYAVTFVTAIGETTPGPVSVSATAGPMPAPASAPTAGTATIGTGPETGAHDYAVTFVNAAGETTEGPRLTKVTDMTAAPVGSPVPTMAAVATGPDPGSHDYAVTFVTSAGETTPSPIGTLPVDYAAPPTTGPFPGAPTITGSIDEGSHDYEATFVNAAGETTPSPNLFASVTTYHLTDPTSAPTVAAVAGPTWPGGTTNFLIGYNFFSAGAHTALSPTTSVTLNLGDLQTRQVSGPVPADTHITGVTAYISNDAGATWNFLAFGGATPGGTFAVSGALGVATGSPAAVNVPAHRVPLTGIPLGDAQCTARKVYRRFNGSGTFKLVTTLADNVTQSYDDTTANASLGADAPGTNTARIQRSVALTAIPTGDANVTSRNLYRTVAAGAQLKFVAAIAGNVTTTYTDSTADAGLGANAPAVSTASLNVNHLTAIPIGPASTTSRLLYRSAASASQLKLLATISGNVTTTYTDSTIDASLGANVPTTNTAALNIIPLTGIPTGDANVTSRKLYRRSGGAGLKLLATLANNTATTYTDSTPNGSLGAAVPATTTASLQRIALSAIPTGDARVTSRKLYRTAAGGAQLKLLATLANNTTTVFADTVTDASLGANVPTTNTATANQVALTALPIGAASVTQRKVYRTATATYDAFGVLTNDPTQLKLLTTIADNVTSVWADSAADGTLGANVPTTDTSGLTQPQGNVLAGSTSLQVASIGTFPAEGWAVIGNGQQVIRYTGVSGNVLTGIPSSGPGSIQATIAFNSTVTAAPQLVGIPTIGVGAIRYPILKGDPVNLWVQVDDLAAQAALSVLLTTAELPHDGIIEDYLQDRRLSYTECLARGRAQLALRSAVDISLTWKSRDINTRAGRTAPVYLLKDGVTGNFRIQSVTISGFGIPGLMPTFAATAGSRFTFEDLLRVARAKI